MRIEFDLARFVDGRERFFDCIRIGNTEVTPAGLLGDVAEQDFVEIRHHLPRADALAFFVDDWHGHDAFASGTERVDRDSAVGRDLGGLSGIERAGVVRSVGEQNHERALALHAVVFSALLEA